MTLSKIRKIISTFTSDHGMVFVLLLLCAYYSWATLSEQNPEGPEAVAQLSRELNASCPSSARVLVVSKGNSEGERFAEALAARLREQGFKAVQVVSGEPVAVRRAVDAAVAAGTPPQVMATTRDYAPFVASIGKRYPALSDVPLKIPDSYTWPTFLLPANLLNVANQIAVIAIVAVGMTMVIITAGIDLSVGSLVALSAVAATWLIGRLGGTDASAPAMVAGCMAAIVLCAGVGVFSGSMITVFRIPPFIVTLAMMQVASGLAYIISRGRPIYQVPDSFVWLGRGTSPLFSLPYAVLLMGAIYALAHVLMTRTVLGRYIYAVGGNAEAARLSGVRVKRVLLFVYAVSGAMAGLGGVLMASQLKSGAPTYGLMYELYVIAAVVVGGSSLSGGQGRVTGTLTGAFIIAVIQNGMNLTNVESYTQKVVLGLVILGSVLLDTLKKRGWSLWPARRGQA